jgi:hypothetical protein
METNNKWDSLTLKEKSEIMKMAISSGITDLKEIRNNYNTFAEGGFTEPPKERFERKRRNDSPTQQGSEAIENNIANRQYQMVKLADSKGHPSDDYYIPYVNEIKIPGIGRTAESILDSIAVNAKRAGIPMEEAYGLAALETYLGAAPNISTEAYIDSYTNKNGKAPSKEQIKEYERKVMNSSFSRNYGGIYPQFLINNHEWHRRGWEESPTYKKKLQNIKSPLHYGFALYNMGLYNTGDVNHKKKVQEKGRQIMSTQAFQEYQKNSKFH